MLNSEIRRLLDEKLTEATQRRAPDLVAGALEALTHEYVDYPLLACILGLCSGWIRDLGLVKARAYMIQLTAALDHGDFSDVNMIEAVRRSQLQERWRRAKPDDRALTLRWSAWLSYEISSAYKILGRALLGMEAT